MSRLDRIPVKLLAASLCLAALTGCSSGQSGDAPNPQVTFELPEEWKGLHESEVNKVSVWGAVVPIPGQEDALDPRDVTSKLWMVELSPADQERPGATPADKAQAYRDEMLKACSPEHYGCTVEPLRTVQHGGIEAQAVATDNNEGTDFDFWTTSFFFGKDGVMFELGVRERFDADLTQRTVQRVLETVQIKPRS